MLVKPRWLLWVRGSLVTAITGHWIANALFDEEQYTSAGLEYTWGASVAIVVQTIVVVLLVVFLGPLSRRTRLAKHPDHRTPPSGSRVMAALLASQLVLFLLLEMSERIVQKDPFTDGLFGSGFIFELLLAIGAALLLAWIGSLAARVMRSLPRQLGTVTFAPRAAPIIRRTTPARHVVVVGRVRAPPSLAA